MKNLFKLMTAILIAVLILSNISNLESKQHIRKPQKTKSIDRLADMNHFLDGVGTTITAINSLGESAIPYCFIPDETASDNENAYWFTSYENLASWLEGKSIKDSVLQDIQVMDSLSNNLDDEHLNSFKRPKVLWGLNYANAYQNYNGTGTSHSYFYWHKTFNSFNNQASRVQMNAPGVIATCIFCTQTRFRGSKLILAALFVSTKDLSGTFYDDNFESVF